MTHSKPEEEVVVHHLSILPAAWLPKCKMERIIVHWTAGKYEPNEIDMKHYHFLINGKGDIYRGEFLVSDNVNCKDGKYAAHTLGLNTGSIGVAVCAMWCGMEEKELKNSSYPMKRKQWNQLAYIVAELSLFYNIPVKGKHILGHGEVEIFYPDKKQKPGKIDPFWLPWAPNLTVKQVGDLFRSNVKRWQMESMCFRPPKNPMKPPSVWA